MRGSGGRRTVTEGKILHTSVEIPVREGERENEEAYSGYEPDQLAAAMTSHGRSIPI